MWAYSRMVVCLVPTVFSRFWSCNVPNGIWRWIRISRPRWKWRIHYSELFDNSKHDAVFYDFWHHFLNLATKTWQSKFLLFLNFSDWRMFFWPFESIAPFSPKLIYFARSPLVNRKMHQGKTFSHFSSWNFVCRQKRK